MSSTLNIGGQVAKCKICILGANGGIGSCLALKLKLNKYVTDLALWDIVNTAGLREDLSHIDTSSRVFAYTGYENNINEALQCSDIVVITAGQGHSPKFPSREAMFDANAGLLLGFMKAIATACHPNMPFIHIVTNPVNTMVPLCAQYLKEIGCPNPRKLIGSASVDSMRARVFLGQLMQCDPSKLVVPVVGGHSSASITPVVSQSKPKFDLSDTQLKQLEDRIVNGAFEVINATKEKRAAFLSIAYCVAKFCDSLCRAIYRHNNVEDVGYVESNVNELDFFACRFSLNHEGVTQFHRLPPMVAYEKELYEKALKDVQLNIKKAEEFLKKYRAQKKT